MGTSRRYCVYAAALLCLLSASALDLCAQDADAPTLKPVDVIQNIPIYFAQSKQFALPNPAASQATAPALTAWACTDQGQTWVKSVVFAAGDFSPSITAAEGV